MIESERLILDANQRVVLFRWYFLAGSISLVFLAKFASTALEGISYFYLLLGSLSLLLVNYLFQFWLGLLKQKSTLLEAKILSIAQITVESSLFIIVVMLPMENLIFFKQIIPLLFFVPLLEAVVLFNFWGPVSVAIGAFFLVNLSVWFWEVGSWSAFYGYFYEALVFKTPLPEFLLESLIIGVFYLIIGLFSAYVSEMINERNRLLAGEADSKLKEISTLREMNERLAESTRALSAKEVELTVANRRLQKLEEAKSKFVSVTTHQLRTPLAAIKWTFDMLLNGQLGSVSPDQINYIKKGYDSTERVITIINDLLKIDLIESEKEMYSFIPVDVIELIDKVLGEFTNQINSKQIKLSFHKPESSVPLIDADINHLRMVVENLMDNAVKYTPQGGEISITVSDERINSTPSLLEVSIADSGIGIPNDEQGKIFQKFFRASNAIKNEPDGSGVGLFIVQDIIERHNGSIIFTNNEPQGTIFRFALPVHQK